MTRRHLPLLIALSARDVHSLSARAFSTSPLSIASVGALISSFLALVSAHLIISKQVWMFCM